MVEGSGNAQTCSVSVAAQRLGVTPQTVRNWVEKDRLKGWRELRGQRRVWVIDAVDLEQRAAKHSGGSRSATTERIERLEERVDQLEHLLRAGSATDSVNVQFANLRLMEVDERNADVIKELQRIVAVYRSIVQQAHLPANVAGAESPDTAP